MRTTLIAATVVTMMSPAMAQTTGTSKPVTAAPMATPPADTAAPATDAVPQGSTVAAPVAAAAPTDPKVIIATEFPTYDKDANGALSKGEFDAWMVALKDKSGDAAMKPADQSAWLRGAFSAADKDKSKSVSLAELTGYLTAAG